MRPPVRVRAVRRAAWAMSCVPPGSDNGDAGVDVRLCNIQFIMASYVARIRIRYTELLRCTVYSKSDKTVTLSLPAGP